MCVCCVRACAKQLATAMQMARALLGLALLGTAASSGAPRSRSACSCAARSAVAALRAHAARGHAPLAIAVVVEDVEPPSERARRVGATAAVEWPQRGEAKIKEHQLAVGTEAN